jgi:hypothetical protein
MNSNSILEEIWRIKHEVAEEAGQDIHRMCENARRWASEHPHAGPYVKNASELRAFLAEREREESLVMREEPPECGDEGGAGGE